MYVCVCACMCAHSYVCTYYETIFPTGRGTFWQSNFCFWHALTHILLCLMSLHTSMPEERNDCICVPVIDQNYDHRNVMYYIFLCVPMLIWSIRIWIRWHQGMMLQTKLIAAADVTIVMSNSQHPGFGMRFVLLILILSWCKLFYLLTYSILMLPFPRLKLGSRWLTINYNLLCPLPSHNPVS